MLFELHNFVEHLNNMHYTIKFSMETSKVEISFLDTMVKLDNGKVVTDLYCKPTDRNNYLPFNSARPYHCKKGLPYRQFLHLKRICSRDEDFLTQSAKKAALLLQKKCPMELFINSYLKAKAKKTGGSSPTEREAISKLEIHTPLILDAGNHANAQFCKFQYNYSDIYSQ